MNASRPITVLIADDHPVVRQGLAVLLEVQDDITLVGQASTGPEAVQLTRQHAPDVLLLDLKLPEVDGLGVLSELAAEQTSTRVLILTSAAGPATPGLALQAGAAGFLAWQAARCVASWDGARVDKGLRRWRAVARSAARQCRRAHIPPVDGVLSTAALTQRIRDEVAAGATVLAVGYLLPFSYLLHSLFWGKKAVANPWGATGLEWRTSSPPPTANFEKTLVVTEMPYEYALATAPKPVYLDPEPTQVAAAKEEQHVH